MEEWEYGVSYDYTVPGIATYNDGIMPVENITIAEKMVEIIAKDERVSNVRILKRPVGNWEDADA